MYCRHWQRWLQWKEEYLEGNSEGGSTAAEAAVYLTYLAYSTGGMSAVKMATCACKFYASLRGPEGSYISDPLINTVVKGLERDFSKPVRQKEGFSPVEIRQLVQHLLKEKISPKLKDLRLACLIQSLRWAPFIWKDSGFGLFQEMTQKTGRKSVSCQLALCKKAPPLLLL